MISVIDEAVGTHGLEVPSERADPGHTVQKDATRTETGQFHATDFKSNSQNVNIASKTYRTIPIDNKRIDNKSGNPVFRNRIRIAEIKSAKNMNKP